MWNHHNACISIPSINASVHKPSSPLFFSKVFLKARPKRGAIHALGEMVLAGAAPNVVAKAAAAYSSAPERDYFLHCNSLRIQETRLLALYPSLDGHLHMVLEDHTFTQVQGRHLVGRVPWMVPSAHSKRVEGTEVLTGGLGASRPVVVVLISHDFLLVIKFVVWCCLCVCCGCL